MILPYFEHLMHLACNILSLLCVACTVGSNASSMDALWDIHPRRLSEAGLSRHADSSAILTEDTDSFIIGERVWVSGNKPGHIAYIGETQFAPGEWAGIALDEPIGKNDGSVGGIHYFQCEPKKGVFSRLTRLTRVPLEGMGSGDTYVASTPSPVGNGVRRGPISPTGSTKSLLKSPVSISMEFRSTSPSGFFQTVLSGGSNNSLASSAAHPIDYRVGDRVIIKSSQGSKVGTVRYIGTTDFANGEWVGVELDDPRGKNDGSVNGTRYFDCRPNFGLFAPVSKVSKSPSKIKPGACQIHSGVGLPPSGLRRTNSKESMLSNLSMTSGTSSVRRDVLKEKQQHIEQLLKERDLERAEITRAASQADEAEQKLTTLRQEYEKYRAECEVKLQEHLTLLNKLKEDRNELVAQLEDERRKNEDLLFRLEEASITKDDIEVTNESNISKIKELEEQLKKERDKVDSLETEANKLFEAEENLCKAKEEIESLRNQLQEARNKQVSLEGDNASTSDQYKKDLEEKDEMIRVLKQEISKLNLETRKSLEKNDNKISELESRCSSKDKEVENLKNELEQVSKLAQEKVEALEKVTTEKLNSETALEKEIDRLKMELSSKSLDLENISEQVKVKDGCLAELQSKLDATVAELESKNKDIGDCQNSFTNIEAGFREEIISLQCDLKLKSDEYDNLVNKITAEVTQREQQIEANNNIISANIEEIKGLKQKLEDIKKTNETATAELQEKLKTDAEAKENQLNVLRTELQKQIEENLNNIEVCNKVKIDFTAKCEEFDKLKAELENTSKELESILAVKTKELETVNESVKQKEEQIQSLRTELQTTKVDLESVSNNLVQYQSNLSNVEENLKKERDEIKETLKSKIVELEETKKEFLEKLSQRDKQVEELTAALVKRNNETETLTRDLNSLKESQEVLVNNTTEEYNKKFSEQNEKLASLSVEVQNKSEEITNLSTKLNQLETTLKEKDTVIEALRNQVEQGLKQHESGLEEVLKLNEEIKHIAQSKQDLCLKVEELEKVRVGLENSKNLQESEIDVLRKDLANREDNLKQREEVIKSLENNLLATKNDLEKASNDLVQYQNNLNDVEANLKKERDEARASLEQKTAEFEGIQKELSSKISETETKLKEATKAVTAKTEKLTKLNNDAAAVKIEHEKVIKETAENHKKEFEELEIKVSDLLTEIENKNAIISKLSDTVATFEGGVTEKDKEVDKLQGELDKLKKRCQADDENTLTLNGKIKELETSNEEFKKLLMESTKQLTELFTKKEKAEDDLKSVVTSAGDATTKLTEMSRKLEEKDALLETTKSELQTKLETLENTVEALSESNKDLESAMDKQKVEYEGKLKEALQSEETLKDIIAASSADAEKMKDLQKNLENAKANLADKDKQLAAQSSEILKLKEELNKEQKKDSNRNGVVENSDPNAASSNSKIDYKQLIEEKLFAESQVAFLNSIIVDMQKKNEEQKARIEILEMGYNSSAADELAALGFRPDKKQPAPRMYCDICEEFDLHETEDCPTQGDDEPPPVNPDFGKEPKQKPPPRSYCELCGVFGHATEDCTEDQEF
ncbi:hypothetical protein NQ315_011076 [Exocentrus adspersus]|uniref:CAP-Gly domain-containing protein n=1 Tax=Exocentrus adspersus TaxID=1586481 RepID=A0AAV8VXK9_9CUCU|nr:hypothetical protein NQ315_011076 [Exocentrus adspersus]